MSIRDEPATKDGWLVVISGRLDQSQNQLLESELQRLLDQGHHRLLIDMSQVTYVNSGALRCLVTIWRQARQQGGNIVLYGLSDHIARVFSVVGFDKVFAIYDDQSSAESALADAGGSA